jgi:hypothetical protein
MADRQDDQHHLDPEATKKLRQQIEAVVVT